MTELLIVRHGETEWNCVERFRDRVDVPLNETGIKQAEAVARYLKPVSVEVVFCSPVPRARQTAEIIARAHNLSATPAEGLTDLDFGDWQGKSIDDVRNTATFRDWLEHPESVQLPHGERLDSARQRAVAMVTEAVKRYKGSVVLVTHRVIVKLLVCALLGLDNSHFWDIGSDTAAISSFTAERGRYILNKHNDTCHLAGAGTAAAGP